MREHDIIIQFVDAMAAAGIPVSAGDIEPDGQIHRIHVEGDRPQSKNAWYVLHCDDRPAGAFGCNKRLGPDARIAWTAKGIEPLTLEQRREWKKKMQAQAERKAKEEQERFEAAAVEAQRIWDAAKPATADHPYLKRKGIVPHDLRVTKWVIESKFNPGEFLTVSDNALLIPLRDKSKRIRSLQAIFPSDDNLLKRDKTYLSGGQKSGLFYTIGKPVSGIILLGEGFATCQSAHEATGHAAVVCFDASNLVTVATLLRKALPAIVIVLIADNDRWTKEPVENPGVHYASKAAKACGGKLAVPEFKDLSSKPTDFNDLHKLEGLDEVRHQIEEVISPSAKPSIPDETRVSTPDDPYGGAPISMDAYGGPDPHPYFKPLGYDHDKFFIFQLEKQQLVTYTKGDFTETGLIALATLQWWETEFPASNGGVDKKAATNWLMRRCYQAGIYDDQRLRGRGAWIDRGRVVYHHGGYLTVDGNPSRITDIESKYVYELQKSLPPPASVPLSDEDGRRLLEIAKVFRWSKPGSAALLSGWVALAPLCGALRWRPHIWLNGGPGCGKTTVMERYVFPLMHEHLLYAQGNSSEAGIRQSLKSDALPVLFEEAESNDEKESARMQGVLALIRQASSESNAKTLKGSAGGEALAFHIRSMFCLASIQKGIKHQADVERLAVLSLRPKHEDRNAAATWETMDALLYSIERDQDIAARLMKRSLDLLSATRKNIETFTKVAAQIFGTQREGDQYGTLLAGCWSLIDKGLATPAQAREMIESYDWSEHLEGSEHDDASLAFTALMDAHIRLQGGLEVTVFELAKVASDFKIEGLSIESVSANAVLQRYGMRVADGRLLLSNKSPQLHKLMAGTPYATDLRAVLLRYEGADRYANKTVRFNGQESKCISLPLDFDGESRPISYGSVGSPASRGRDFDAF